MWKKPLKKEIDRESEWLYSELNLNENGMELQIQDDDDDDDDSQQREKIKKKRWNSEMSSKQYGKTTIKYNFLMIACFHPIFT